jgi:hypothetical protein
MLGVAGRAAVAAGENLAAVDQAVGHRSMAAAIGAAIISTALSLVWALSSKCLATRAIRSIFFKRFGAVKWHHSTSQLDEDLELDPPRHGFLCRSGDDTRALSLSPASIARRRPVFGARHVAQLVAAPFDADGIAVVAVVRLADQRQRIADLSSPSTLFARRSTGCRPAANSAPACGRFRPARRPARQQANRQQKTHF